MKVKVRKMKMILKIVKMKILKIVKTKMTTVVNMKIIRIVKMRKTTTKKKAMEAPLVKAIRGILFLKIPVRKMKMMWMINLKKKRSF